MPCRENLVALISPHNASFKDSLGEVKAELERRGKYEFLEISSREIKGGASPKSILTFFVVKPVKLARAKYIFLNDNFMPLSRTALRKNTVVTQLWHGEGSFKKIGLALNLPPDIERDERRLYRKYTYIVCSSPTLVPLYKEAFDADEKSILPLGTPRTDAFFRPFDYEKARREFDVLYPACKGKKLVLYAPTFRDNSESDSKLMSHFDEARFAEKFGNECALLLRLHPQIHSFHSTVNAVDVTDYPDVGILLRLADLLITDYSSICMDFALLDKPSVYYAFDLEEYSRERAFYGRYEDIVPGKIARSFDELLEAVENPDFSEEQLRKFREYHLGACDGGATVRVLDRVMK